MIEKRYLIERAVGPGVSPVLFTVQNRNEQNHLCILSK